MGTNAIRRRNNANTPPRRKKSAKSKSRSGGLHRTRKTKPAPKSKTAPAGLSVALSGHLLRQLDRRAKAAGVTRDEFVAACVRLGLASPSVITAPRRSSKNGAGKSKEVGAGLDQVLTWMADQQAVLSQIRDSLNEVAAAVPVDNRPPTPEPGDDGDDDDDEEETRGDRVPS